MKLLRANDYRDKTPAEIVNEGEAWESIEREKAKERQRAKGNQYEGKENFPDHQTGQSRDKAAEKVGVSGKTYEKGKQVKEIATSESDDVSPEVREVAQQQWSGMQDGE